MYVLHCRIHCVCVQLLQLAVISMPKHQFMVHFIRFFVKFFLTCLVFLQNGNLDGKLCGKCVIYMKCLECKWCGTVFGDLGHFVGTFRVQTNAAVPNYGHTYKRCVHSGIVWEIQQQTHHKQNKCIYCITIFYVHMKTLFQANIYCH